jgi:hypothetical protein
MQSTVTLANLIKYYNIQFVQGDIPSVISAGNYRHSRGRELWTLLTPRRNQLYSTTPYGELYYDAIEAIN